MPLLTYYHKQKKRPPLQPPRHRCIAVAYVTSTSTNNRPDSELRYATATHRCLGGCSGGLFYESRTLMEDPKRRDTFFSIYDSTGRMLFTFSAPLWRNKQVGKCHHFPNEIPSSVRSIQ